MRTLYESILDPTKKKVKKIKKELMTLGGHYKLDCRVSFVPMEIETMDKYRLKTLTSGKDFITKEFEKKFNAWEKEAKIGRYHSYTKAQIDAVKCFMIWLDNLNIVDLNISENIKEGMMVRNYSEPMAEFLNAKLREANIFDDWESVHFFTGTSISNGRGHYLIRGYTIQDPFELYISEK